MEPDHVVTLHFELTDKFGSRFFGGERGFEIAVSFEKPAEIDCGEEADRFFRFFGECKIAVFVDDDAAGCSDRRLIQNSRQVKRTAGNDVRACRNGEGAPHLICLNGVAAGFRERIIVFGDRCSEQNPGNFLLCRTEPDRRHTAEFRRYAEF